MLTPWVMRTGLLGEEARLTSKDSVSSKMVSLDMEMLTHSLREDASLSSVNNGIFETAT